MGTRTISACIVSFGLILVQPNIHTVAKSDIREVSGENEIQGNLRSLFDSIAKNDVRNTGAYRNLLEGEAVKEQQAFDTMKEKFRFLRQKSPDKQKDSHHRSGDFNGRKLAAKRDTHEQPTTPKAGNLFMFKLTTVPPIFEDIQANNMESVKRRIEEEKPALLGVLNVNNETVAHIAAKENNLLMLKYVLSLEPSLLHATDKWENTPLSVAIDKGAIDMVRYLVEDLKADILRPHRQRFGNMPIHIAAEQDQTEILKYFVEERKVDVEALNFLKETPIFLAVETPSMNALRYLVEHTKANVQALDSNRGNILYSSAMKGELQVIKYLIDDRKIPFDINYQDRFGRTIAYVAARFQQMPYLKYLVEEKGADIHLKNNMGWNALFEAAYQGHVDVTRYLAEKGAELDGKDIYDRTLEQTCDENLKTLIQELKQERNRTRRDVSQSVVQPQSPERC